MHRRKTILSVTLQPHFGMGCGMVLLADISAFRLASMNERWSWTLACCIFSSVRPQMLFINKRNWAMTHWDPPTILTNLKRQLNQWSRDTQIRTTDTNVQVVFSHFPFGFFASVFALRRLLKTTKRMNVLVKCSRHRDIYFVCRAVASHLEWISGAQRMYKLRWHTQELTISCRCAAFVFLSLSLSISRRCQFNSILSLEISCSN